MDRDTRLAALLVTMPLWIWFVPTLIVFLIVRGIVWGLRDHRRKARYRRGRQQLRRSRHGRPARSAQRSTPPRNRRPVGQDRPFVWREGY